MNIYLAGNKISRTHTQSVSFIHRELIISCAQGEAFNGTEFIVFDEQRRDLVDNIECDLFNRTHSSIGDAVKAADKIADAVELGLIVFQDED